MSHPDTLTLPIKGEAPPAPRLARCLGNCGLIQVGIGRADFNAW
jgi:hypothetical protein